MEMMAELQLYKLIVKIKVVYNNYCTNHVKRFQMMTLTLASAASDPLLLPLWERGWSWWQDDSKGVNL